MIKYKIFNLLENFETNTYLVWDTESNEAIIIDPSAPSENLANTISAMKLKIVHIFNTHGHGDHIGGNEYFHRLYNCPIGIHPYDADMLLNSALNLSDFMYTPIISPAASFLLKDRDSIYLGEFKGTVFHTPGHTKGGVVIYFEPYLFSGDTLFDLSVGRTDLPGGDSKQLSDSIKEKIFSLPDSTIVLPGHGGSSTVGKEKQENPFIN
ncbi:MAG TPA: MBL fold metallo-hydrolase [Candidatus Cloacimonadota bacterium]|jgi:glyoxylase-like metal-dependent hydrolase (beta-lactamase superfamily II)|nr:MBL fold metallo-hydrolase [Candidatus Cloacimonadales bacterium]HPY95682.1 MBL fold metallo-hydrolase [Candidatus Cloacimonadota bacterium]HQB40354.1 MBL fold metallo-hydrolase [Candidatus Cloacimonadota bacterium]